MGVDDGAVAAAKAHELVEGDTKSANGVIVDAALPRSMSCVWMTCDLLTLCAIAPAAASH